MTDGAGPEPPGSITEQQHPLGLAALPVEVVEAIGQFLPLRDRAALLSCCRELWAHPGLRASARLWGSLSFSYKDFEPRERRLPSLAAWLRRRAGACRCVAQARSSVSFMVGGAHSLQRS